MTGEEGYVTAEAVWTEKGLQAARNDLIETGVLYVTHEDGDLDKIRKLDRYLWDQGIRFNRSKQGNVQRYEFVSARLS